jgi:hypothetical protein
MVRHGTTRALEYARTCWAAPVALTLAVARADAGHCSENAAVGVVPLFGYTEKLNCCCLRW